MLLVGFILIICFLIILSLKWFWTTYRKSNLSITFENFILLLMTYSTMLIGFGLIYLLLELHGFHILLEAGERLQGDYFEHLEASMYFSAITILSVGYGDITPIGVGRVVSILEALLGYSMPAAFVVRTVIDYEKEEK